MHIKYKQGSILFYTLTLLLIMGILFTATNTIYLSQRRNLKTLSDGMVAQAIADRSLQLFREGQVKETKRQQLIEKQQLENKEAFQNLKKDYQVYQEEQQKLKVEQDNAIDNAITDETSEKDLKAPKQIDNQSLAVQKVYEEQLKKLEQEQSVLQKQLQLLVDKESQRAEYAFNLGKSQLQIMNKQLICHVYLNDEAQYYRFEFPIN
ncbi:hypothetical protein [Aerococcus vaginalis]